MGRTLRARRLIWAGVARAWAPLTVRVSATRRETMRRARLARLLALLTSQGPAAPPREALGRTGRTGMARKVAPPKAQELQAAPREVLGRMGMARGPAQPMGQAALRARQPRALPTALRPAVALQATPGRAAVARSSAAVRKEGPGREVTGGGGGGQGGLGRGAQVLLQGVGWAT